MPSVFCAWHVTGDVDYEMRLTCQDLAAPGTVLHDLRHCCGAEVASAGLLLGEATGLADPGQPDRPAP